MAIRILPPDVAARIAAGEVVERPASVVKELIENALDAGASTIAIEIAGGGIDSIRVSDDGCGIEVGELETAFLRHATSKLENDADLIRVLTLGFRGEALPSIAAVAEVEMVSRAAHSDAAAVIRLIPEAPAEVGARGAPVGTSVTVRRLFGRLPARRKFLRTQASETTAVTAVASHYALAYPEVRFTLSLDGKETMQTPGSGDMRDAVSAIYGTDLATAMLTVGARSEGLGAREGLVREQIGGGAIGVDGLVSPPHLSRASRGYISLFVNRRWIQNRRLTFAVEEAYQGLLMVGRHSIAMLNLRIPPEEVDVNVHPTKAEVRFRDESAAFAAIQRAVRTALVESSPVPSASMGRTLGLTGQPSALSLWQAGIEIAGRGEPRSGVAIEARPSGPEGVPFTPTQALPVLRVIGQMGGTYVVAEGPDGMYLIDQHAAHERVLYEQFWRRRQEQVPEVQALLEPIPLELSARQRALLAEESESLAAHGFEVEPFGEGAFLLRSLPRALAAGDVRQTVLEFLDTMLEESEGDRRDRVAMSLACHGAIRAGKTLALEEMRELVRLLEESEAPNTCPHGRPTMLHMSAELLAQEFGRR